MDTEREARIKRLKALSNMAKASIPSRGGILESVIMLEDILTNIIAWCFHPAPDVSEADVTDQLDKYGIELKFLILSKINFNNKIDILKDVVLVKKPSVWKANKELVQEIVRGLKKIKTIRNLLAHSPLDMSKEYSLSVEDNANPESFQVLKYRKGKIEKVTIDKDRIKLELRKMQATWFRLLQLFALLRDDRQDAETCKRLAELSNSLTDEDEDRGLKELFKAYGLDHS